MKRFVNSTLSLVLCVTVLLGCLGLTSYAGSSYELDAAQWEGVWDAWCEDATAPIINPGSDESERNISWYSPLDAGDCYIRLASNPDMTGAVRVYGTYVKTPQGDRRNFVKLTGLERGCTYYYQCRTDAKSGAVKSFETASGNDFSAMYTTDIHVAGDGSNMDELSARSYKLHRTLAAACDRADISLVLSTGDQASSGLRAEYSALAASPVLSSVSFAPTIGNHDKKGIDFGYFMNTPNEYDRAITSLAIGGDYWFVKGNALFLVMDSNNASMVDHRAFIKSAVKANPDVKWRVAMFHHDLYGGRLPDREDENRLLRLVWTPVLDEFKVDLVLLGHSHYYTISNVMYNNKTVQSTANLDTLVNPAGTIYMVSGSINNPRTLEDGEVPPLGENAGQSYITPEMIYNILDFSDDSIIIRSYTVESGEEFNRFTITKTTDDGGHPDERNSLLDYFLRGISLIAGLFGNLDVNFNFLKTWITNS